MDAFSVDSTVWSDFIREALRISGQDPDVVSRYVRWSGGEKARTKHPIGAKYRYDARSCSIADFERDVTRVLSGLCGETAGDCPWIWAEACSSPVNDVLASMRLQNCSQPEEPAAIEGEPDADMAKSHASMAHELVLAARDSRQMAIAGIKSAIEASRTIATMSAELATIQTEVRMGQNRDLLERQVLLMERAFPHVERGLAAMMVQAGAKPAASPPVDGAKLTPTETIEAHIAAANAAVSGVIATASGDPAALTDDQIARLRGGLRGVLMALDGIAAQRGVA